MSTQHVSIEIFRNKDRAIAVRESLKKAGAHGLQFRSEKNGTMTVAACLCGPNDPPTDERLALWIRNVATLEQFEQLPREFRQYRQDALSKS